MVPRVRHAAAVVLVVVAVTACAAGGEGASDVTAVTTADGGTASPGPDLPGTATTTGPPPTTSTAVTTTVPLPPGVTDPPAWLGTRPLPLRDDGFGEVQPTPPELVDRRFTTEDLLAPPAGGGFAATIDPVPAEVAARSTWHEGCPVTLDQLRYVTVSFRGFDELAHTGELLVNADAAEALVSVFERLWDERYPIEGMRITSATELDLPPTGDGNNTEVFVCRPATGGTSWSRHAYGLAIDVNPFHNPYVNGDLVLPELASAYVDRDRRLPGMLEAGDPVVDAFATIGWEWGGAWSSLKDYQHFSDTGT